MRDGTAGGRIEEEARNLVEVLGGRWTNDGGLCRCPGHDDRSPSLSIRAGRTRLLFHCFAGCAATDILRMLQSRGLLSAGRAMRFEIPRHDEHRASAAALRIWNSSRPIAGSIAQDYLASRGLGSASPELRFNPRTPHGRHPLTRFRPALIAAVRDESGLLAIHRTFLDEAFAPSRTGVLRCGLGRFGSGAVRLGGFAPRLGLAEGIETALSATILFGIPCWATLGSERLGRIALPSGVEQLALFLDHDRGGRRAEALARDAYPHLKRIDAFYPPRAGEDWNDVLRSSSGE